MVISKKIDFGGGGTSPPRPPGINGPGACVIVVFGHVALAVCFV